ncbi:MAG: hypothetical protein JSU72_13415 [Deltaproteobacteria bacterium]|nr:MAG: hypothetical protein JSU72_13415 [Deltaproteobacteria bacterium]
MAELAKSVEKITGNSNELALDTRVGSGKRTCRAKVRGSENKWTRYEAEKARIAAIARDSAEYEQLIRKLCRELGL